MHFARPAGGHPLGDGHGTNPAPWPAMLDALLIVATAAFFAIAWAYVRLAEGL
ncbi:MAG: hypothetical protein NVSMB23_29240 [Myxococcales bacterium]